MNIVGFQVFGLLVVVGALVFLSSFISLDFHIATESLERHKAGRFDAFFHFRGKRDNSGMTSNAKVEGTRKSYSTTRSHDTGGLKFDTDGRDHGEELELDEEHLLRQAAQKEAEQVEVARARERRQQQKLLRVAALSTPEQPAQGGHGNWDSAGNDDKEYYQYSRYYYEEEDEGGVDTDYYYYAAAAAAITDVDLTSSSAAAGTTSAAEITRHQPPSGCRLHFPAQCPMNPLVKYWDEVTECYSSPLRHLGGMGGTGEGTGGGTGRSEEVPLEDRRFVVFQPDLGGWNNIRMALEVVILFAQVTGRILVLPPSSVLHMLTLNENWDDNKSGMEDYFDFSRLRAGGGLQTMPMKGFLATVAARGLLSLPLPDGNTDLIRKPLWEYLEKACYTRLWSPGKQFIGFNITSLYTNGTVPAGSEGRNPGPEAYIGDFSSVDPARLTAFGLGGKRVLLPYDLEMHKQRAIYFPGDDPNRMLTHFYSYLFFATPHEDRRAKRFMRDRLRYHDTIFCTGSRLVEKLLLLHRHIIEEGSGGSGGDGEVRRDDVERSILNGDYESDYGKDGTVAPQYVAFHIRRGDFMKQTKIPAEKIVELTKHLVPDRHERIAYIATDEKNRSFFEPFEREYRRVFFLSDLKNGTDVGITNQNYVGMIEQVVCASAHTFVGTPLSTFTAYMTRMRGYMNRTLTYHVNFHPAQQAQQRARQQLYPLHAHHHPAGEGMVRQPGAVLDRGGLYRRTFYFLPEYMHMLQTKPFMHAPLNLQDFADVFYHIDDDSVL